MKISPALLLDSYKTGHHLQYPIGTQSVLSNMTPRGSRDPKVKSVVFFGLQYYLLHYLTLWDNDFFGVSKNKAIERYQKYVGAGLGPAAPSPTHLEQLWDIGYLPIEIRALPEGTLVPMRVPFYTIENTSVSHITDESYNFYWLTNFLETQMSTAIWMPVTNATIAHNFRLLCDKYAAVTSDTPEFTAWQGHDFSMRGMSSIESALVSSSAHLLSFTGTDTFSAFPFLETYYKADVTKELIGGSVSATEHAVVCANGVGKEETTLKRLLTEVYPSGIFAYVSDTWDFWKLVTVTLPALKHLIMNRDGKLVIRPDSGDPVKILIGDEEATEECVRKGLIQCLWETFGGTTNSKGYRVLDPHIGAIYGDSITIERADQIMHGLMRKGFASTNIVFGIGSYTYQYNTRDTFGLAIKATHAKINEESFDLYKAPKTDSGIKNSAKGRVMVVRDETGNLKLIDQVSEEQFRSSENLLNVVYKNGSVKVQHSLSEIRERLQASRKQLLMTI